MSVPSGGGPRAERVVGAHDAESASPRAGVPVVAALAVVVLVAALSSGLLSRVRGSAGGLSLHALLGDATAVVLVAAIAGLGFAAQDEWRRRRQGPTRPGSVGRWRFARPSFDPETLLAPLVVAALVALLLGIAMLATPADHRSAARTQLAPRPPGQAPVTHAAAGNGSSVPLDGIALLVVAVIVAIAVAVFALRGWRRRRAQAQPALEEPDMLVAALEESLEDLDREPDPRRAVIKAYDRMERALAEQGVARRLAETPLEYLRRALSAVHVNQRSISRLTDLFEQARFSHHWIDAAMKQEAIGALSALRAELEAAGAAGAP